MGIPKAVAWQAPRLVPVVLATNAAVLTAPDTAAFISDARYELVRVDSCQSTAGTGGAATLDIKKASGTTAPASGTSMLTTTFNLENTANTVVSKTISNGGLSTTQSTRQIASGDRICLDFTGTLTSLTGVCVTLWLKPLSRPSY